MLACFVKSWGTGKKGPIPESPFANAPKHPLYLFEICMYYGQNPFIFPTIRGHPVRRASTQCTSRTATISTYFRPSNCDSFPASFHWLSTSPKFSPNTSSLCCSRARTAHSSFVFSLDRSACLLFSLPLSSSWMTGKCWCALALYRGSTTRVSKKSHGKRRLPGFEPRLPERRTRGCGTSPQRTRSARAVRPVSDE